MARLLKAGKIREIGPRFYTSLPDSQVKSAVRGSWSDIISHLFPQVLLSHRSALEYRPSPKGEIFLTGATNREIHYPGLTLVFIRGPKPRADDPQFLQFHVSSFSRALLENLSSTKRTADRVLSVSELEQKLENTLQMKGEEELNRIRDQARIIAKGLKWQREFKKLDSMIGALLGTRSVQGLQSVAAQARARGRPYDHLPIEKFDLLFSELIQPVSELKDPFKSPSHFRNKAFFESYFSNYIEGTTFEIEEAEEIIFQNRIPKDRPKDGHDVLGTFQMVSDVNEMKRTPEQFEDFESLLKQRHSVLLGARPEVFPGDYKKKPNRAGSTEFTSPQLVQGTLEKGFERYLSLPKGIPRAIFIMFLVAEVHPFTDGNGRIARIMMNAELFSQGLGTIIIPTAYREDYLLSLRALTRMNRPKPFIQMLTKAQKISLLDFSQYPSILRYLQDHHWFLEPDEGKLIE